MKRVYAQSIFIVTLWNCALVSMHPDEQLIRAVIEKNAAGVEQALVLKANVNTALSPAQEEEWMGAKSVLHIALKHDDTAVSKLLLEHGADVCKAQDNGLTPLHIATFFHNHADSIDALIKKGAQVNAKAGNTTVLELAATRNDPNIAAIEMLLNNGADKESIDRAVQALEERVQEEEDVLRDEDDEEYRQSLEADIARTRSIINLLYDRPVAGLVQRIQRG